MLPGPHHVQSSYQVAFASFAPIHDVVFVADAFGAAGKLNPARLSRCTADALRSPVQRS